MIDVLREEVISLSAAARLTPRLREDRPVSPSTLWRWGVRGVKGVRLETIKVGGVTATSVEALERFFATLNGQQPEPETDRGCPSHEAVEQELSSRGI
jgi:hypothetical protein